MDHLKFVPVRKITLSDSLETKIYTDRNTNIHKCSVDILIEFCIYVN